MKSILKKQESFVTENVKRDADLLKSTADNAAVNVVNPSLGDDVNNKMGDAAAEKIGDEKSIKSYRDTIKQEKRVNFRVLMENEGEIKNSGFDDYTNDDEGSGLEKLEESTNCYDDTYNALFSNEDIKKGASTPSIQGHIHDKVVKLRKELEDTQILIDSSPHDGDLRAKEAECLKEFVEASMDEEKFVKQKAKVKWLAEGDANTNYFHNILKCRNNKKAIHSVLGVDGMVLEGDLMIHEFVSFYENFLGGEHDQPTLPSLDLFSKRLDEDMASSMNGILSLLPFDEGKFPVKYLGVPLISSRLNSQQCAVLTDRIESRISSWNNKYLSFAGRLQLICSNLSSMHVFWAAAFLLRVFTSKEIEVKLRRFLWGIKDDNKATAKVSWKKVMMVFVEVEVDEGQGCVDGRWPDAKEADSGVRRTKMML
ncbi:hypothetical protein QVD17_00074 [Tagetes erecta]|uniref:RNA-directed DNA polymerase, eukaryota, reverse transcriptase zinc-binding domain protein n=1 Tax=Tagetes erecta TaxID=13708 RepID=A0AAD8L7Y0_TARER|nr:hypothetical protein QVD17_00074 [Tagetes erecta]